MARVLLVEDEVLISMSTGMLLKDEGYLVEVASDGARGLEMALASPPDLIITDYMMPRMNGLDMIVELRARGSRMPIVLATSVPETQLPPSYSGGHDAHITKPYYVAQILEIIARLLG
ncbi:response regulator [Skermanella rosea]|uniref:response regulator transcription factor n=1 Tax=Skermanella rosea TaxID=1817965 RepID=UPI0019340374|nr:response regulator [Skermanella rosea]UEM01461.1 response regulator [Skermanella rosea]